MSSDKVKVADEIKHLSSCEIEELYKKYLNGEKNAVLVSDYKIKISPNKLIRFLPPKKINNKICPYCNIAMYLKRQSKSSRIWNDNPIECYECNHKLYSEKPRHSYKKCNCKNCIDLLEKTKITAEKEFREKIFKKYNIESIKPIGYINLTFFDKLILLTLSRIKINERFLCILSLDEYTAIDVLSPTQQMDVEVIRSLYKSKVIIIDPNSDADAFVEDEESSSFYINKVRWVVNVGLDGDRRSSLNEVYQKIYKELNGVVKEKCKEELLEILFAISREEVLQYVYIISNELKVDFNAEIKTRRIANQLLKKFSVSEIYYFIRKSVESAHLYYVKGLSNGKQHAANTIPNKMLSLGERAYNEKWKTYKYNRDSRAPRSAISKVFYEFFLQDGDAGFYKAPGQYWNQEICPKYFSSSSSNSDENKIYCSQCSSNDVTVKLLSGILKITCNDCDKIMSFISNE